MSFDETADVMLARIVVMLLSILLIGFVLKRFNQPYFVAYIIAGVVLGPQGVGLFKEVDIIAAIGSLGLIMQMFFIGAEIEVHALLKNFKTLAIATFVQLFLSLAFVGIIGVALGWPREQIVLFTFVISVSSSAIILEYLRKNNELNTRLGIITTGILILQDFLIVPMILTLNFVGHKSIELESLAMGICVTIGFIIILRAVVLKRKFKIEFLKNVNVDHDLQVFVGLSLCFGFAWITNQLHLSAAMGAMLAGILIGQSESTKWLEIKLSPFRVFFISFFFFSIGLQLDMSFVAQNWAAVLTVVLVILIINSGINALVFRMLSETWKNSVYAGALLSQIGEFSLILCVTARSLGLVDNFSFQLTLAVIAFTMLFTSGWIGFIRGFAFPEKQSQMTLMK